MTKFNSILLLSLLLQSNVFAQTMVTVMNQNNVSANINDNGCFFNDLMNGSQGYEVPAGSNKHVMYTGSLWFSGRDVNDQIKLSAQVYCQGKDFWAGPITQYDPSEWAPNDWNTIHGYFGPTLWTVTKAEIDNHIQHYQDAGYVMPASIQGWPAHGDTTIGTGSGMLPFIAPFVDTDYDGHYDPSQGDYPCIKGDKATFLIMSDRGVSHDETNGQPIGMEMHYMFYQYSSIPELMNVTFMDVEVVNMGTQTLYDFTSSFFADIDLGNYMDDYVGCDTNRNMVYGYNGDGYDENNGVALGYESLPPAFGIISLSHPMHSSRSISSGAQPPSNDPSGVFEMYNAMNGNLNDGSDQLDGNGLPTNFTYSGDPNNINEWSEESLSNPPGDRRVLLSTNHGVFNPDFPNYLNNGRLNLSYALVFAQGTDNLNSVTELFSVADYVQDFYDTLSSNCMNPLTVGMEENKNVDFSMHPNPSAGTVTIQLPQTYSNVEVEVHDVSGRKVFASGYNEVQHLNLELNEKSGMYLVIVKIDGRSSVQRLVIH